MNVRTFKDWTDTMYDNLVPEGSYIRNVKVDGEFYTGLWCSMWGSWTVSVPIKYCKPELDVTGKEGELC